MFFHVMFNMWIRPEVIAPNNRLQDLPKDEVKAIAGAAALHTSLGAGKGGSIFRRVGHGQVPFNFL